MTSTPDRARRRVSGSPYFLGGRWQACALHESVHMQRALPPALVGAVVVGVLFTSGVARADDEPRGEGPPAPDTVALETTSTTPLSLRFDSGVGGRFRSGGLHPGLDLGFAFGGQPTRHFAWWVAPRFFGDVWASDMKAYSASLLGEVEGVWDTFRLGGGFGPAYSGITASDTASALPMVAARVFMQLDLVREPGFGVFMRASFDAAVPALGPSLTLGFDLGVRRARPAAAPIASK
jgi:hypothetical protein